MQSTTSISFCTFALPILASASILTAQDQAGWNFSFGASKSCDSDFKNSSNSLSWDSKELEFGYATAIGDDSVFALNDFLLKEDAGDTAARAIRPEGWGVSVFYERKFLDGVTCDVRVSGISENKFEPCEHGKKISVFKTDSAIIGSAGLSFEL